MAGKALVIASLFGVFGPSLGQRVICNPSIDDNSTIHDFSLKDVHNRNVIDLSAYRGKLVLMVNVATY